MVYNERGRACTPPSLAWADLTIMMECTPESGHFHSVCTLRGADPLGSRYIVRALNSEARGPIYCIVHRTPLFLTLSPTLHKEGMYYCISFTLLSYLFAPPPPLFSLFFIFKSVPSLYYSRFLSYSSYFSSTFIHIIVFLIYFSFSSSLPSPVLFVLIPSILFGFLLFVSLTVVSCFAHHLNRAYLSFFFFLFLDCPFPRDLFHSFPAISLISLHSASYYHPITNTLIIPTVFLFRFY